MNGKSDIKSVILKFGLFIVFLGLIIFAFSFEFAGKIIALVGMLILFFAGLKDIIIKN